MNEINQAIHDAIWLREIDQMSTREIAEKFQIPMSYTRAILLRLVRGKSGDSRFQINSERGEGVIISDGSTFNYSPMDLNEGGMSANAPKHYIWFCD